MNKKVNKYMSMAAVFAVCSAIMSCNDKNTAENIGKNTGISTVITNMTTNSKNTGDSDKTESDEIIENNIYERK